MVYINPQIDETNLKTFNTAKLFAESILFPLMETYKKYQRQADFGAEDLNQASTLPEEIREIQRYNGLKGQGECVYNLIDGIKSTVLIHNNKEEIQRMNSIITTIKKIKLLFYDDKERFFNSSFRNQTKVDTINRIYFEQIKEVIEVCYTNVEILMTRNKLLFADSKDEYASDAEIMEQIKKEYVGE